MQIISAYIEGDFFIRAAERSAFPAPLNIRMWHSLYDTLGRELTRRD